jgi:integrase
MRKLISMLFQEYISTQKLAANSIAIKKRAFKHFLSILGDCQLPSKNKLPCEKYINTLHEKTSARTVETYKRNLSSFFSWLVKHEYLKSNPFSGLQVKQMPPIPLVSFKPKELFRIFKVADKRWKAIVTLALCGLRRSEILNLCRNDIDLGNGRILITPKVDSFLTWEWENKNCLQTPVPLPKTIDWECFQICPQNEIKELLSFIPLDQLYVCLKPRHYSLMLQKKAEGNISFEDSNCPWRSFTRDFGLLLKKAKVKHKRFEDLRVTYAMSLARMKVKVKSAQKLLRHRNALTTYTHYQRYKNIISEDLIDEYYI